MLIAYYNNITFKTFVNNIYVPVKREIIFYYIVRSRPCLDVPPIMFGKRFKKMEIILIFLWKKTDFEGPIVFGGK